MPKQTLQQKIRRALGRFTAKRIAMILLGTAILSFGIHNIHQRTAITEGGVIGLVLLINHWFGVPASVASPLLDAASYALAFKFLGWDFLLSAGVASVSLAGFYRIWECLPPMLPDLTPWPLAAALLGELICDPVTYHGRFVPEYFESEKTNLLEAIRSLINDKRDWADSRLLRALCDGEAYAVPRLGDEETVDKLQALKVYTQYRDLISTAPLEIIYSGSADLERVKQALAAAFATLPREEVRVISTAAPHVCRESVQHVEDVLDVTQGKLGMGFSCGSDDMPALLMGNTLFGGSSNSKLFLNVREKLSLCYYASSLYHRQKGLITVSSGIEFQNYQRAYDEIMAQLEAVQKGELEDRELEGARATLLNNYATVGDSQGKLENFYLGQAATGQHETPADLARAIQDMTAERICRAMSTVKLDTVYFLKGKEAEA